MLLEKATFQAGLMLSIISSRPKPNFEVPPEDEENRHERKDHACQPEIQYEHGPDDKDRVESGLEGIGYETRSQFRHLINILFHSVELLTHGCCFVVARGETVHLREDFQSNPENKVLHCARIDQCPKARET